MESGVGKFRQHQDSDVWPRGSSGDCLVCVRLSAAAEAIHIGVEWTLVTRSESLPGAAQVLRRREVASSKKLPLHHSACGLRLPDWNRSSWRHPTGREAGPYARSSITC